MSQRRRSNTDNANNITSSERFKKRGNLLSSNTSATYMIPVELRPIVERLQKLESPSLSREEIISIVFIIRIGNELHRGFYATFLTTSLINKLSKTLLLDSTNTDDNNYYENSLSVEIEVFQLRWMYRQGSGFNITKRIIPDYDMDAVGVLSKIGQGVLDTTITPQQGLQLIHDYSSKRKQMGERYEWYYQEFPGRLLIIPFMSFSCCATYFGGTWLDVAFSTICGIIAGMIAYICSLHSLLSGVMDYVVAIVTAMIATISISIYPNDTCLSAQVLGTLYWFFYGTAFVMALYEITNNELNLGVTRFIQATIRTYGLAIGSILGIWIAAYGGAARWDAMNASCSVKNGQISDVWFIALFPISAIACLLQFRVPIKNFPIAFITQTIAYGSQYIIGTTWNLPDFLSNIIPAFLTIISSHYLIFLTHRFKVFTLDVEFDSKYTRNSPKTKKEQDQESPFKNESSSNENFRDEGIGLDLYSSAILRSENNVNNEELLRVARSDLWFCLLPALYLLVPGSKLLQSTFSEMVTSLGDVKEEDLNTGEMATSLLIIALSQVIGLRLGFVFLSGMYALTDRFSKIF